MALHHASSGEIINLESHGETLSNAASTALFKTEELEVIRMAVHAGREVPEHSVPGETTLQCIQGAVELRLRDGTRQLRKGQLVWLEGNEPHTLYGVEDALLLVTILLKHGEEANQGIKH